MPSNLPIDHGSKEWLAEYPELCEQLDPALNLGVDPADVRFGSGKRLWWRCLAGPDHVWQQRVCNRTRGSGCPFCAGARVSVTNSLATRFPALAKEWHPQSNGKLTPDDVVGGGTAVVWWKCALGPDHEWRAPLSRRSLDRHGCPFCAGFRASVTNSLATRFPELAKQWHRTRNRGLTPSTVVAGATTRVWWRCNKGTDHVWRASLHDRTQCGHGCPFCAGVRASRSNSLRARAPHLVVEWDPKRNALSIDDVVAASKRRAWWRCEKSPDHCWEAAIANRAINGAGCPFCANRAVAKSNCLARRAPEIAKLWDSKRNGVTPARVVAGGRSRYWWRCRTRARHAWQSTVARQVSRGAVCPRCIE